MPPMHSLISRVISTGGYLPQKIMSNDDFEKIVDTSDEWIYSRTGIKQRHIADESEMTSDLAKAASEQALNNASMTALDIDAIVVATTSPDLTFPSTATILQSKIGAKKAFALDVQAVCAGFVYALSVGDNFIRSGQAKNVLVVGADIMSRLVDWSDRRTCVLFGDGAGAVILRADNKDQQKGVLSKGVHRVDLESDGEYHADLCTTAGPSYMQKTGTIHMGRNIFKLAVQSLVKSVKRLVTDYDLDYQDIDWIVPHQANQRIIESMIEHLRFPEEKVISYVETHANTSGATIPLALHQGMTDGRIKDNQLIILNAIGGGLTWGGGLLRWG